MTTYPLEFHRRSEQKWVLRAQAARESPRAPHWSVIVGRTNPNVVTSWPEGHGCGKWGDGCGPSTVPPTNLSRNVSPRS